MSGLSEPMRQALISTLEHGHSDRSMYDRTMIALESRGWIRRGLRKNPRMPVWNLSCWLPTPKAIMTQKAQRLACRAVKGLANARQ